MSFERPDYNIQNTSVSEDSVSNFDEITQISPATRFNFVRDKTEKWGKMLLWVGYFMVLTNGFGLGMTLMNVAGVFSPDGKYFGQESLT
jgi:hypothetical protein